MASHKNFSDKYGLSITPLSDTELSAIQAYDVWKRKKICMAKRSWALYGQPHLIDENGMD